MKSKSKKKKGEGGLGGLKNSRTTETQRSIESAAGKEPETERERKVGRWWRGKVKGGGEEEQAATTAR